MANLDKKNSNLAKGAAEFNQGLRGAGVPAGPWLVASSLPFIYKIFWRKFLLKQILIWLNQVVPPALNLNQNFKSWSINCNFLGTKLARCAMHAIINIRRLFRKERVAVVSWKYWVYFKMRAWRENQHSFLWEKGWHKHKNRQNWKKHKRESSKHHTHKGF